jgi:hypothetical protein
VLILDEPTAGLDPAGCGKICWPTSGTYRTADRGGTVILVSHSMDDVARNVDRIMVFSGPPGCCMDGTPRQVFSRADELPGIGAGRAPDHRGWPWRCGERGVPIDPAVYTDRAAGIGSCGAAAEGGGAHAEGRITLGQYFPGNTWCTGWTPARRSSGDPLHRGSVQRRRLVVLRLVLVVTAGCVRVSAWAQGGILVQGTEAADAHHRSRRC